MQEQFRLRQTTIQRIGYSYYVSLPIEWLRHHGLRKGVRLNAILGEDGRLVLEVPAEEGVTQ